MSSLPRALSGVLAQLPICQLCLVFQWRATVKRCYHRLGYATCPMTLDNEASSKIRLRSACLSFPSPVSCVVSTSLDITSVLDTSLLPVTHPEIGNEPEHWLDAFTHSSEAASCRTYGYPIDAGTFHGHGVHPVLEEPVGQGM